jgi:hypothetical protein
MDQPGIIITSIILLAAGGVLFASLIFWGVAPLSQPLPARLVLSSFVGLGAFCLAVSDYESLQWWDALFQRFLLKFVSNAVVTLVARTVYPGAYLLGAWGLGFTLTFHLLMLRRRKTEEDQVLVKS